jgi:hypothetical protein
MQYVKHIGAWNAQIDFYHELAEEVVLSNGGIVTEVLIATNREDYAIDAICLNDQWVDEGDIFTSACAELVSALDEKFCDLACDRYDAEAEYYWQDQYNVA